MDSNESVINKMQRKYWITKQTVFRKLGKKEDEFIVSSDSELDAKLELFNSIQQTTTDLLKIISRYQNNLSTLAIEENEMGNFMKEYGKIDKTRAGKMMTAVGTSMSYTGQQRFVMQTPLDRLYHKLETFHRRAIADTLQTVQRMERTRTEYRAALNWLKDISSELDPDTYKHMERFKKSYDFCVLKELSDLKPGSSIAQQVNDANDDNLLEFKEEEFIRDDTENTTAEKEDANDLLCLDIPSSTSADLLSDFVSDSSQTVPTSPNNFYLPSQLLSMQSKNLLSTPEIIQNEEMEGNVCISGDCDSLGNWLSNTIVPMTYNEIMKSWSVEVNLPTDRDVKYRYYTCTEDYSFSPRKIMIHQWETNLQPRIIKQNQKSPEIDVFGMFDGIQKVEVGWLNDDLVVELRINSNSIQWVPECSNKKLLNENGKFRKQDESGYSYEDVESVVFMTRTFSLEQQGFVFEFIDNADNQNSKTYFGYLMFEEKFHGSDGVVKIPIHSADHEYLGSLSVKYVIIRPSPEINCSFKVSYAKYWNNSWTGLEIGHRGTGISFGRVTENNAKCRENTIGSFKAAVQNGAHLIEFDVQLTNDKVPTIYHDFHVLLEVRNKLETPKRQMIFPFHKLNYEELKNFQVHHVNEINGAFSFENDDHEDYSPFPSLEEVLHAVDPQIGFNVEIKYTSILQDGSKEYDHPIDMNEYVDKILQVVFANAGRRYIVFSSFSPDICAMARLKQNKYPVMFLTQGVTSRYPPYSDKRMKSIENAINFANCADLLGIVAHSENLLGDCELVKRILNNKLVLFCWGDDNNDNNNIAKLKEQGVHGIIFDRIDKLGEKPKKELFEKCIL
ncbi:hypothetical protein V9T40_000038 [Parthenolecanium corni]|uniref:GP-PDE domain-containing protein n=1 Tax=Parthenolecanium corni TaxID=536013 RepID=A0AAN9Y305_9HEMI